MDRLAELTADYAVLGQKLGDAQGAQAAAIVHERRVLSELIERLSAGGEGSLVDQLAQRRAKSGVSRSSSRRRKSG